MRVLITGVAGFIGFHCAQRLLAEAATERVVGVDNLNTYYDPTLKAARLLQIVSKKKFSFVQADIANAETMQKIWADIKVTRCAPGMAIFIGADIVTTSLPTWFF